MAEKIDVQGHIFVPKHTKLSDEEKQKILEQFNISLHQLPRIHKTDPAIAQLDAKPGDVIKIERKSVTTGKSFFYRVVANA